MESLSEMLTVESPDRCPLFQELLPRMASEATPVAGGRSYTAHSDVIGGGSVLNLVHRALTVIGPKTLTVLPIRMRPPPPNCRREALVVSGRLPSLGPSYAGAPCPKVGADALDPSMDMGQQLWDSLLLDEPLSRKSEKLVKSRFFGLLRAVRREAAQWSSRLFGYLTVCLEVDFLGAMNHAKMKAIEPKPGKKPDTSSNKEGEEEMTPRKAAGNQMVMGTVFMLDSRNRDILLCILEAVAPLERWYSEQNEQIRSPAGHTSG